MRRRRALLARTSIARGAFLTLGLLMWVAEDARAEIYEWTDASGRLHFSQDIQKVPSAKREEARRVAKERKKRDPLQVYDSSDRGDHAPAARRSTHASRRVMRIPFEPHGSLMRVEVLLNGRVRAPFFIDTGASGVSIPWSIAQKLGLQITDSTPRIRVGTANGVVAEPVVRLKSVQLGPATVKDLDAAVSGSMDVGLLGGAFFNNYVYEVDAAARVITLKPNDRVRGGMNQAQWRDRFDAIREPLNRLEAYIEAGGFTEKGRVRELEEHRTKLRASLDELEQEANKARVPRGWRE